VRDLIRLLIAIVVALSIVALLVWARNDAGVDDRAPDPEDATAAIVVEGEARAAV
jgi:hypothetical protein